MVPMLKHCFQLHTSQAYVSVTTPSYSYGMPSFALPLTQHQAGRDVSSLGAASGEN